MTENDEVELNRVNYDYKAHDVDNDLVETRYNKIRSLLLSVDWRLILTMISVLTNIIILSYSVPTLSDKQTSLSASVGELRMETNSLLNAFPQVNTINDMLEQNVITMLEISNVNNKMNSLSMTMNSISNITDYMIKSSINIYSNIDNVIKSYLLYSDIYKSLQSSSNQLTRVIELNLTCLNPNSFGPNNPILYFFYYYFPNTVMFDSRSPVSISSDGIFSGITLTNNNHGPMYTMMYNQTHYYFRATNNGMISTFIVRYKIGSYSRQIYGSAGLSPQFGHFYFTNFGEFYSSVSSFNVDTLYPLMNFNGSRYNIDDIIIL